MRGEFISVTQLADELVRIPWDRSATSADEAGEIGAEMGLLHGLLVEPLPTPRRSRGLLPVRGPPSQLLLVDQQLETAAGDVQLDQVAVLHQCQRPTHGRFRRHVQDDGALGGAAHARVGDPHDVRDASAQQLRR